MVLPPRAPLTPQMSRRVGWVRAGAVLRGWPDTTQSVPPDIREFIYHRLFSQACVADVHERVVCSGWWPGQEHLTEYAVLVAGVEEALLRFREKNPTTSPPLPISVEEERDILWLYSQGHLTQQGLADNYGISIPTVRRILRRQHLK